MIALSVGMPRCKGGTLGVALWMLAGACTSGCSFLFVDAPSDDARNGRSVEALDCTSSRAWPTTDVIVGSVMALESFATFSDGTSGFNASGTSSSNVYIVPAVAAAGAALFVASGVSGYRRTSECRQAKRDIQLRELPNGPPGAPPRGFAPGYAPYAPTAAPPPYDPWTAQPAAPPPSQRPGAPSDPAWGAPPPPNPGPPAPAPAPVAPATPPGGGGW
jgi:hypothetical protein